MFFLFSYVLNNQIKTLQPYIREIPEKLERVTKKNAEKKKIDHKYLNFFNAFKYIIFQRQLFFKFNLQVN